MFKEAVIPENSLSNQKRFEVAVQKLGKSILCDRCSKRNIEEKLYHPENLRGRNAFFCLYEEDPRCSFCTFMFSYFDGQYKIDRSRKYAALQAGKYRTSINGIKVSFTQPRIAEVAEDWDDIKLQTEDLNKLYTGFMLCPATASANPHHDLSENSTLPNRSRTAAEFPGRLIDAEKIDWTLVREWINTCKVEHAECSPSVEGSRILPASLVELRTRNIVETPPDARWMILSYVWGTDLDDNRLVMSKTCLDESGSLILDMLPNTIADAIVAATELGAEYLWVDVLCVDQGDDDKKAREIAKFHAIVYQADLCLVAASGRAANEGLPGVRARSRNIQQQFTTIGSSIIMSRNWGLTSLLLQDGNSWMKRGWTYQELVLSHRCLFFSKGQLYYRCQTLESTEDMASPRILTDQDRSTIPETIASMNYHDISAAAKDYRTAVSRYSERVLSFESDRLAAFTAIATRFAQTLRSTTLFGMIVATLHQDLLWELRHLETSRIVTIGELHDLTRIRHYSTQPELQSNPSLNLPTWTWATQTSHANISFPDPLETRLNIQRLKSFALSDLFGYLTTSKALFSLPSRLPKPEASCWTLPEPNLMLLKASLQLADPPPGSATVLLVFEAQFLTATDIRTEWQKHTYLNRWNVRVPYFDILNKLESLEKRWKTFLDRNSVIERDSAVLEVEVVPILFEEVIYSELGDTSSEEDDNNYDQHEKSAPNIKKQTKPQSCPPEIMKTKLRCLVMGRVKGIAYRIGIITMDLEKWQLFRKLVRQKVYTLA